MRGAIAAGHPLTAQAGADILAAGGGAVDALVGAAFAAFVAEGPLTGPAGGGFLLHRSPEGSVALLDCFFEVPSAPRGEMEEIIVDFGDATQSFHVGDQSVAVPGLVSGLAEAHSRWGRLPWRELVEPAIVLARGGIEPSEAQRYLHHIIVPILQRTEAGRRIYGDPRHVRTEELVPTLMELRDGGAPALTTLLPGLEADLRAYRVEEREPLETMYGGCRVLTTPLPSRGGEVIRDALAYLDQSNTLAAVPHAIALAYAGGASSAKLTGTTHVSVLGGDGETAAVSMTLGAGSGEFRHGFQLNNMLGELDVIGPGPHPPGERLPSMMSPTLVLEREQPRLVLGSAGSVRLAGAIIQVARRVLTGEPVAAAVDAPRLHPDGATLHLEGGWPEEICARFERDGWSVTRWADRNLFFGGVSAAEVAPGGGLAAAGDPRRGGAGVVVP